MGTISFTLQDKSDQTIKQKLVPTWVKNTAGWWASDTISDVEFINALQFLIKEKIIKVEQKEDKWFVPVELKKSLKELPRTDVANSSLLGLHGWLNHHLAPRMPRELLPNVLSNTYAVLQSEESIRERISALPEDAKDFLMTLINEYGGLVGVKKVQNDFSGIDIRYLRETFEQSSLASIVDVDWHQFGIREEGLVFVVFHEVLRVVLTEKVKDFSS